MYAFTEIQVSVILPILIIFVSLLCKIIINNNFSSVGIGEELIKFPSDISILSLSFVSTFLITNHEDNFRSSILSGLVYLFIIFIFSLLTYVLTKKTTDLYFLDNKNWRQLGITVLLLISTYAISVPILYMSIVLLVSGVK